MSACLAIGEISRFFDFDLGFEDDEEAAPGFCGGVTPDFSQGGADGFFLSAAPAFGPEAAGFPVDFFAMLHASRGRHTVVCLSDPISGRIEVEHGRAEIRSMVRDARTCIRGPGVS